MLKLREWRSSSTVKDIKPTTSHHLPSIIKPCYNNANLFKHVNTINTNNTKHIHKHKDTEIITHIHISNNLLATHTRINDISTYTPTKNQLSQYDLNFNNSISNNNNNYNLNNNNLINLVINLVMIDYYK